MRVGEWAQCIGEKVESFVEEREEKVREFEYKNKSALVCICTLAERVEAADGFCTKYFIGVRPVPG